MKKINTLKNNKYVIPMISLAIVLALISGVTYAWISSQTNGIENKFQLQKMDVELKETFENDVKSDVYVENTSEATVYVRIALVEQLTTSEGLIKANTEDSYFTYTGLNTSEWLKIGEYYYYTKPLTSNQKTKILFEKATPNYVVTNGEELSLTVMMEAIQINGIGEWNGVNVKDDGTLQGGRS